MTVANKFTYKTRLYLSRVILLAWCSTVLQAPPLAANEVQLASVYKGEDAQQYLVSEKFDGVRAIWKNQKLVTRQGNIIRAPSWFTQHFPDVWLDGELWFARKQFEQAASIVSKDNPVDEQWTNITYMVFDAPNYQDDFAKRAAFYTDLIGQLSIKHLNAVKQFTVVDNQELSYLLSEYTKHGAEGLMLHKKTAKFESGRSKNILKLKPYMDAEATVVAHLTGKGKYTNMLGSLLVEIIGTDGRPIQFKIGSGFSDAQRINPPPIGSKITYQFHGYTRLGKPRFASFLRQR